MLGFVNINDLCDVDNINDDLDCVVNCLVLGIFVGFEVNDNVSIEIVLGGNFDFFFEGSELRMIGIVWILEFLENFFVMVDFYDIEIEDVIIEVGV